MRVTDEMAQGTQGGSDASIESVKVEFVNVYEDKDGNRVEQSSGTWDANANNTASNSKRIGVDWEGSGQDRPRDIPDKIKKL